MVKNPAILIHGNIETHLFFRMLKIRSLQILKVCRQRNVKSIYLRSDKLEI